MKTIEVRYMGGIERPARHVRTGYHWVDGYSVVVDGTVTYPWMTKREAEAEAMKLRKAEAEAMKLRKAYDNAGS